MRYVACSERGSEPPSPPGSFFSFYRKEIYFFSSPLYFSKRDRRHPTYLRGGLTPPGAGEGAGEGLPPHRAGRGCNPPTGTRSQVRYVGCSERGSEPPSPPGFSFFPFVQKKYFFSVSPLYFQKETKLRCNRQPTSHRRLSPLPTPWRLTRPATTARSHSLSPHVHS